MISSAISYYPVRHLTLGKTFFEARSRGDYSPIIEDFKNIAQQCIKDGADVLIAGCGALSPVLTVNSVTEIDGAPIIDPIQVSLKFAEILVDFKASGMPIASNKGLFLKASKDNILNVRKSLGLI
jgi:allantoin racemase